MQSAWLPVYQQAHLRMSLGSGLHDLQWLACQTQRTSVTVMRALTVNLPNIDISLLCGTGARV